MGDDGLKNYLDGKNGNSLASGLGQLGYNQSHSSKSTYSSPSTRNFGESAVSGLGLGTLIKAALIYTGFLTVISPFIPDEETKFKDNVTLQMSSTNGRDSGFLLTPSFKKYADKTLITHAVWGKRSSYAYALTKNFNMYIYGVGNNPNEALYALLRVCYLRKDCDKKDVITFSPPEENIRKYCYYSSFYNDGKPLVKIFKGVAGSEQEALDKIKIFTSSKKPIAIRGNVIFCNHDTTRGTFDYFKRKIPSIDIN